MQLRHVRVFMSCQYWGGLVKVYTDLHNEDWNLFEV